ncbi:hypothetical protein E8E14_006677 [Neopestalotiopsis sp. 37M]|nr:hypothetical protein E8E14_006677 [Neopestalotiopsis sp. 37M]
MKQINGDYWKAGSNWIALYVFLACLPMVVVTIFIVSHLRHRRQLEREKEARRRGTAWTYSYALRPPLSASPKPEQKKKVTLLHRRGRNLLSIYTNDLEMERMGVRAERGTPTKTPAKKSPLKMA